MQGQGKKDNGMGGPGLTLASHASQASSGTGSQATPAGWEGSSEDQKWMGCRWRVGWWMMESWAKDRVETEIGNYY